MSILESCISFVGGSLVSGITWDLIKKGGLSLLTKFKEQLNSYFKKREQAERYLQLIAEKETYDMEDPFRDAVLLYLRENDFENKEAFRNALTKWIRENIADFQNISKNGIGSQTGLSIGTQNIYGGHVENIGIQYHQTGE